MRLLCGVLWLASVRALEVRRTPLRSIHVRGSDAAPFLDALLSANSRPLAAVDAALLDYKGCITDILTVVHLGDADRGLCVLCTDGDAVQRELLKRLVNERVTVALTADLVLDLLLAPGDAVELLGATVDLSAKVRGLLGVDGVESLGGVDGVDGAVLVGGTTLRGSGLRLVVNAADVGADLRALLDADAPTWDDARIRAGRPLAGTDFCGDSPKTPLEAGLAWCCDSAKGCYLGAEPLTKVRKSKAGPRLRLRGVAFAEAGARPGDDIFVDGKRAGALTSVSSDGLRALVFVGRATDVVGATITSARGPGTLVALPYTDANFDPAADDGEDDVEEVDEAAVAEAARKAAKLAAMQARLAAFQKK
ncbi:hypothetical protein M885DRAFT_506157 [Pelagophyceae sp. CCMP2097]|nr:hypothetical protein M885DRAFT_506157 [Pelagophyceae sp. CCMP2097]